MRKITFSIPKRIVLSISLMLCLFCIIVYFIIYTSDDRARAVVDRASIEKNTIISQKNSVILLENKKLLLENQTMLSPEVYNDRTADSIYNLIRINDSIIYSHMIELENNYNEIK